MSKNLQEYGFWSSPLSAETVAVAGVSLSEPRANKRWVCWLERRPEEAGRSVLVCRPARSDAPTQPFDVTPPGFGVRSRAHEYGGGAYALAGDVLWFVNADDQGIYRQRLGLDEEALPRASDAALFFSREGARFADLLPLEAEGFDAGLIAVMEQHGEDEGLEPSNSLVWIDADGRLQLLAAGADFVASPCVFFSAEKGSPARLAWLSWDHPNMPWDGCSLWLADFDGDGIHAPRCVAGGERESVFQPGFSADGRLFYVSDRSGYWNLEWLDPERPEQREALCPMEAEFGLPQWVFGMRCWDFVSDDAIACVFSRDGFWHAARLALSDSVLEPLALPFTEYNGLCAMRSDSAGGTEFVAIGGHSAMANAVLAIDAVTQQWSVLNEASLPPLAEDWISRPAAVSFPSEDCRVSHALLYRPCNPQCEAASDRPPPLIMKLHGGPTAQARTSLDLGIQFWTTRGFAVIDLNYSGSTGYGRAYRERLDGLWGEVDVDDCVNAALWAVQQGEADGEALIIRGSSAGGFTTLASLAFRSVFKAGASYYGIGDLERLAQDTHKFESRYLERLVGPYPERAQTYKARSPLYKADRIEAPVIFFQGEDDKVVPPEQAQAMFDALKAKGKTTALRCFEGEGHGFRRADTIASCLNEELAFYQRLWKPTGS